MYNDAFSDLCRDGLCTLPKQLDDADSSWHLYMIRITSEKEGREAGGSAATVAKAEMPATAVTETTAVTATTAATATAATTAATATSATATAATAATTTKGASVTTAVTDVTAVTAARRDRIFSALKSMGLGVNLHYIPVYLHPYYRKLGYKEGLCPVAEAHYSSIITLPLYPSMSDDDVQYVIDCVKGLLLQH